MFAVFLQVTSFVIIFQMVNFFYNNIIKQTLDRKILYGAAVVGLLISFIYGIVTSPPSENLVRDNFEPAVDRDGNLIYRPNWLFGKFWDELEENGQIVTSYRCSNLVRMINQNEGLVDIDQIFEEWKLDCVIPN